MGQRATMTGERTDAAIDVRVAPGLAPALDALAERADPTRGFLRAAWYAATGEAGARTLVASAADGTPVAAVPIVGLGPALLGARGVPGSYWPFRSLALAGGAGVDELAALLASPAAEAALAPMWRLGPIYADDPAAALLRRAAPRAGWTVVTRTLGATWLLDLAARPPRADRRADGYRRRLAASGPVALRTITGADWSDAVLDQLARVEANSWIGAETDGSGAKFLAPAQRARWARAVRDPAIAAALSATVLTLADEPIAFSFDLAAGPVQYAIASSYDRRFAAARPGRIVTAHQLARAAAAGIERVDLGIGDSGYKREMGAAPGPEVLDLLLVRHRAAAQLVGWRWGAMSALTGDLLLTPGPATCAAPPRPRLGRLVPPILAAGALAAMALSVAE